MATSSAQAPTRTKTVELCAETTKAGDPCPHPRQKKRDSPYCWTHDPERAAERRRAAQRNASSRDGARRRLRKVEKELPEVRRLILELMRAAMADELSPRQQKQVQNIVQATHALNRAANIELEYRRHVEQTGVPPEQAGGVIEELASEAERLMEDVIEGEHGAIRL